MFQKRNQLNILNQSKCAGAAKTKQLLTKSKHENGFAQITGSFIWTDSGTSSGNAFSCDKDEKSQCLNVGPSFLHVINICAVLTFYSLIILRLISSRYLKRDGPTAETDNLMSFSKPLMLITGAYLVFLLPMAFMESCLFGYRYKSKFLRVAIVNW